MSKIGQVVPEIWAKKWSKTGKNEQTIIGHANILRNMRDREFGPKANNRPDGQYWPERRVLAHHPEDPSLEFWDFTDFHQVFAFLL